MDQPKVSQLVAAGRLLTNVCHSAAKLAGWWTPEMLLNRLTFSSKLCLIHSEVSESMEGDRKDVMDAHLPHREMREVELADALIRIYDLAGAFNLDVAGAMEEKLAYNKQRLDHKEAARNSYGGKQY